MTDPPHYVHGSSPDEQSRLGLMNDLINLPALREIGLRGGERILDVGCGLAQLTRAMADAAGPSGCVVGVERDAHQLDEAQRLAALAGDEPRVDFRTGDALDLPLRDDEWASFDIVHARFVLEHVSDPSVVVREMTRACRPGGRVVLQDDDHDVMRLWPEPDPFPAVWNAYARSYAVVGQDGYIGRKLVALLHEASVRPTRSTWLNYGTCAGDPTFAAYVDNLVGVIAGARETIVAAAEVGPADVDEAVEALRAWKDRPDAALWYAVCWAEGVRPAP